LAETAVYAGYGVPTSDIPIPPHDLYYPSGLGVKPYDPERAKSLLKQAGYGGGLTQTLLTSTVVSGMVDLAATFAKSAAAAGIHVNIKEWAPATYWDQVWTVKPFYTTYWETLYPPDGLWYVYAPTAAYNEAKLKLPQVTKAFNTIMKTGSRQKQVQVSQDIYHQLANVWGHIIPTITNAPWVASPKLQGVVPDQPYFRAIFTRASLSK
jgi:peptide/nickel transport system substrate-binding protein